MKKNGFLFCALLVCALLLFGVYAADTVYLDGTGTTAGAYTTLADAAAAVDDGGTIIVVRDITTPNAVLSLPAKAITLTAENGAVLTLGRTLRLGGDLTLETITLKNGAAAGQDFIYACGHTLTVKASVTTLPNPATDRYFVLYAGDNNAATASGTLLLRGGTWRTVILGSYSKAVSGTVTAEIDGAVITNSMYAGNSNGGTNTAAVQMTVKSGEVADITKSTYYTGAYAVTLTGGTVTKLRLDGTVDLTGGGSVTLAAYTGTLTTVAAEGYEVLVNGTSYYTRKVEGVTETTVYVDGTGQTAGAYTDITEAFIALAGGGRILVVGDTALEEAFTVPEFFGDITVTSQNGAKLTLSANLGFAKNKNGKSVTLDLPVVTTSAVKLLGGYHSVTFTENFAVDGTLHFFGGMDCTALSDNADAIAELPYAITVNGGTFGKFAAGSVRSAATMVGSIAAEVTVTINAGTFQNGVSLSGQSILAANGTLNINGGEFTHPIHAQATLGAVNSTAASLSGTVASDRSYYAIDGDIAICITGGTFVGGEIGAYEDYAAHTQVMRGNFTVCITGGSFTDGTVIDATQVKAYPGENKFASVSYDANTYSFRPVRFDSVNGVLTPYDEPLRVAFVGDSITEGFAPSGAGVNLLTGSYPARFAANAAADGRDVLVSNFGASASGMLPTTHFYYPDMLGYRLVTEEADADYIVLALGTNDSPAGGAAGTMQTFIEEYTAFANALALLPETDKVYITSAILYNNANMSLTNTRLTSVVRPLQEQIANTLAAENDTFAFIDLYGLTLDAASKEGFLSTDLVHPTKAGYIAMGDAVYGAIFHGDTAEYRKTEVYVSESGTPFGAGTASDPISRLDVALSMLTPGMDAVLHIVGAADCAVELALPVSVSSLTVVGEGTDAVLRFGGGRLLCGSDVQFDNIRLTATAKAELYGRFNRVEFTESVSLGGDWSFYAGHPVYTADATEKLNDTAEAVSSPSDVTVLLNGAGAFTTLSLGNNALTDASPIGDYAGNMTARIGQKISAAEAKAIGDNTLSGSSTVIYPDTMTVSGGDHVTLAPYTPETVLHTYKDGVCTECGYLYPYSTVYVSGSGTGDGTSAAFPMASYTNAAEALPSGGRLVLVGDLATPTNAVWTLPAKAITLTAENGAVLTLGRTLRLGGDLTLETITLKNGAAAGQDFIYACGHTLTAKASVTTLPNPATDRYFVLYAGDNNAATASGTLRLRGGTWRTVILGSYSKAVSGTVTAEIDGAVITNSMYAGNSNGGTNTAAVQMTVKSGTVADITKSSYYSGTYAVTLTGGTVKKLRLDGTVDLTGGGSVTLDEYTGALTTKAAEGYEITVSDGVYTAKKKENTDMEPKTVYLDGTGKTEGAYTSLSAALADMPGGGTVVLCGDTEIKTAAVLPETAPILITSKYDGEDYTETAALKVCANLTFGADTTLRDIVLERTLKTSANLFIAANGHTLTVDTGVICLNYTGMQELSLVGGALAGTKTGDTHLTVRSGHFRNVFGGNYNGDFIGNSYVEITGGVFDNAVCGGSYNGNFTGDAHLTFGGNAAMINASGIQGIIGGTLGVNNSTAAVFEGDTFLTLCGDAASIYVFGASRNGNITNKGDVTVRITDNFTSFSTVFGGGHTAALEGNVHLTVESGCIKANLFGGSYRGAIRGDIDMEILDGMFSYYSVSTHASGSYPAGTRNTYAASQEAAVDGNVRLTVRGGKFYGDVICGGKEANAPVTGSAQALFTGGRVYGRVGSAGKAVIDLSAGGSFEVGVASEVTSLIGGGRLILAAAAPLTVGSLSGTVQFSVNGQPLPIDCICADTVTGSVQYTAQGAETLTQNGNTFALTFDGAVKQTLVTVHHPAGTNCTLTRGGCHTPHNGQETDYTGERSEPVSVGETETIYLLTPGYYTVCVNYTNAATYKEGNYRFKAIYVYGNSPTQSVTVDFPKALYQGFEVRYGTSYTDEILEKFYDPEDLTGYAAPDTPYFNDRPGSPIYSTNDEVHDFVMEKAQTCPYMYAFDDIVSTNGYTVPYAVFTADGIPQGAGIEEIAGIVGQKEGREILFFTGGVHGNEPCGTEGMLAFISELCGDYGRRVLEGTDIGAIIVFPRVNPEGFYIFTRGTPYNPVNTNLNRDYMVLGDKVTSKVVYVARLFGPTVFVDHHEAYQGPIVSDGDLMTDIYDIGISHGYSLSSAIIDSKAVLYGDREASESYGDILSGRVMAALGEIGIRSHYYEKRPMTACGQNYFSNCGSYGFFAEVPGLLGGSENIARRTFTQMSAAKMFVELAIELDGEIARRVAENRKKTELSAQVYDPRSIVDLSCKQSHLPYSDLYTWNDPLVAMDGTVREENNPISQYNYDVPVRYRTRPTAYVFPADTEQLSTVLGVLDRQGIPYKRLSDGVTLTLQRYSGTTTAAVLGDTEKVTFPQGAYLVPVDGYLANIIAILFEPENFNAEEGAATLAQANYLPVTDIYRSTESFIAAKSGMAGTYSAHPLASGKTVAAVTLNGESIPVYTEGDTLYLPDFGDPYAVAEITYTDGGTEKTGILRGDTDGDYTLSVADALIALRDLLNEAPYAPAGDMNGDGNVTLLDVIRILKACAE